MTGHEISESKELVMVNQHDRNIFAEFLVPEQRCNKLSEHVVQNQFFTDTFPIFCCDVSDARDQIEDGTLFFNGNKVEAMIFRPSLHDCVEERDAFVVILGLHKTGPSWSTISLVTVDRLVGDGGVGVHRDPFRLSGIEFDQCVILRLTIECDLELI